MAIVKNGKEEDSAIFDCITQEAERQRVKHPEEQEEIAAKVELLEEHGPNLGRPHADVITTSRHSNMKELRGKVTVKGKDRFLRALFVFDPRTAPDRR